MATIAAANKVPRMLALKIMEDKKAGDIIKIGEQVKMTPLDDEKQEKLNSKLDLTGIENWTQEQKDQVKQLFVDYGCLFPLES